MKKLNGSAVFCLDSFQNKNISNLLLPVYRILTTRYFILFSDNHRFYTLQTQKGADPGGGGVLRVSTFSSILGDPEF